MLFGVAKKFRSFLIESNQDFTFFPAESDKIKLKGIDPVDLYIHIPFCKSMCPYCPYNRVRYEKNLVKPYLTAILKEIDLYKKKTGDINIGSVYIGGGTPTNLIDELGIILGKIKSEFNVTGNISLETSVYDINDSNVGKLKKMGVEQISIGVQSFDDKFLQFLGRNYKAKDIVPAIEIVKAYNFKSVNVDIMFALPGQNTDDVLSDIEGALNLGVDQITVYPLFTFPYTTVGKYKSIKKLKMPNPLIRRRMYYGIYELLEKRGYKRVSVWGFKRGTAPEYSSVTRDRYIGFGAGAATYTGNLFYFNTFSIVAYEDTLKKGKLPVSLAMPVSDKLSNFYWLYWRLYEGKFNINEYKRRFIRDRKADLLMKMFKRFGMIKREEQFNSLTKRGAFWVHLMQNYFMLDYINKVWTISMKKAWPEKIDI